MQEVDWSVFDELGAGDMLFIDSSHVIMPYGDTLCELLTILPRLRKGTLVHIHDIFLPFDYQDWGYRNLVFTEQWALNLFLIGAQDEWEVVWTSYGFKRHPPHLEELLKVIPKDKCCSGGSFWIRKLKDYKPIANFYPV